MAYERYTRDYQRIGKLDDYKHNLLKRKGFQKLHRLLLSMDKTEDDFEEWITDHLLCTVNTLRKLREKRCLFNAL